MKANDIVVIGAGLTGATIAQQIVEKTDRNVLLIEKSSKVGGMCATTPYKDIVLHDYGPHIFFTKEKELWDYVNRFGDFRQYRAQVKASVDDRLYSLPFNMNTFQELWGIKEPYLAAQKLAKSKVKFENPDLNFETKALSLVGEELYQKFIYGYTKKQWGCEPKELPAFIISRLPIRLYYDNSYQSALFSGIPIEGYTKLVENMVDHPRIKVKLNEDGNNYKPDFHTGAIDEFYKYKFGELGYRYLSFVWARAMLDKYGVQAVNFPGLNVAHTRIACNKHLGCHDSECNIVSYEYSHGEMADGRIQAYPINTPKNNDLYQKYKSKSDINFTGRLGSYKYVNMDQAIKLGMETAQCLKNSK